jgi:hypothetical protein
MSDFITLPSGKPDPAKPTSYAPIVPVDELAFLGNRKVMSAPGIVNPGNMMDKHRDWEYAYVNPIEGFMGVRWCPSWIWTDTQIAAWQPASADVYRVQRKGEAGDEARTLVFTCSPNSNAIPVGDPVVIWEAADDVTTSDNISHDLAGYNLSLKTKLRVSSCTPSQIYDTAGRQIIEIDTGGVLPVIDYLPPFFTTSSGSQKSTMRLRHWEFYGNPATKQLRLPLPAFAQNTRIAVLSGGHAILGGNQRASADYDWSKEYINFGASLTEELFRKECEGLADYFNDLPPSRLAVELENFVVHPWNGVGSVPGYKTLLNDVWYPIARKAWGQERTLIVKGPGTANGAVWHFDWAPPKGERVHLAMHTSDSGIIGLDGPVGFYNIAESDWLAQALRDRIDLLGFSGGGVTALRIDSPQNTVEKAKKMGRVLTSFYNKNLYTWYYAHLGTDPDFTPNVADVFTINGFRIEALYDEMRRYASRSGLVTE